MQQIFAYFHLTFHFPVNIFECFPDWIRHGWQTPATDYTRMAIQAGEMFSSKRRNYWSLDVSCLQRYFRISKCTVGRLLEVNTITAHRISWTAMITTRYHSASSFRTSRESLSWWISVIQVTRRWVFLASVFMIFSLKLFSDHIRLATTPWKVHTWS